MERNRFAAFASAQIGLPFLSAMLPPIGSVPVEGFEPARGVDPERQSGVRDIVDFPGESGAVRAAKYRSYAAEAEGMAIKTATRETREGFLILANGWHRLASAAGRTV